MPSSKPLYPLTTAVRLAQSERAVRQAESRPPGAGKHLFASWSAPTFATGLSGAVWRVPTIDGVARVFNVLELLLRLETPGSTTTTVVCQYSAGGGVFIPATLAQVSCTSGVYENAVTAGYGPIRSGQVLRLNFTAAGTGAAKYTVQLEGLAL
jgi:hypothetical protein